jgi:glycosyltransferase involved in cell wall biosynthesis
VVTRRIRVALVSTPFVAVPPRQYGGTELVVAELARALGQRGVEVVVYATGDSALPGVEVRSLFRRPVWPPSVGTERAHAAWALRDVSRDPRPFDLVHSHCSATLELSRHCAVPMVHTMHHDRDAALSALYAATPGVHRVGISRSQASREPSGAHSVVHHGLAPDRFAPRPQRGYLLFLGRYCRAKAPHLAIDAAQRAGLPIVLAGRPHLEPGEGDYLQRELMPRLRLPRVRELGPVGGPQKAGLIAGARAVLFPVQWEEPFGLVMIEAMLSGVPVIALRRGSVPEVVDEGLTGAICADMGEMVAAVRCAHLFDRARVRAHAARRFSALRMAEGYLGAYRRALEEAARGGEQSKLGA